MFCVEWVSIQLVEGIRGGICISEFDECISMRVQTIAYMRAGNASPIALACLIVPWYGDIVRLYRGAFSCKLLCDFCQELLEFGLVDDGNAIDD